MLATEFLLSASLILAGAQSFLCADSSSSGTEAVLLPRWWIESDNLQLVCRDLLKNMASPEFERFPSCKVYDQANLNEDDSKLDAKELFDSAGQSMERFKPDRKTFLIVHGIGESMHSDWIVNLRRTILENEDANVVVYDWSGIDLKAAPPNQVYHYVRTYLDFLSDYMYDRLTIIGREDSGNVDWSKFHCVGFSIGAQLCGMLGNIIARQKSGQKSSEIVELGQITALDPASPCFTHFNKFTESGKLGWFSADFVRVVHTDATSFGVNENLGHVDIYVNGGMRQPGCPKVQATLTPDTSDLSTDDDTTSNASEEMKSEESDDEMADVRSNTDEASSSSTNKRLSSDRNCNHEFARDLYNSFYRYEEEPNQPAKEKSISTSQCNASLTPKEWALDPTARCYPVAYKCRSWEAFKVGECGSSPKDDARSMHVGLPGIFTKLAQKEFNKGERILDSKYVSLRSINYIDGPEPSTTSGDSHFNFIDEPIDDDEDEDHDEGTEKAIQQLKRHSANKYFINVGKHGNCSYTYQVLIAVDRRDVSSHKSTSHLKMKAPMVEESGNQGSSSSSTTVPQPQSSLYLEIPFKSADQSRFVKLSHVIDSQTLALAFLFEDTIESHIVPDYMHGGKNIAFYTALVPFESLPRDTCEELNYEPKSPYQLCAPLRRIHQLNVFSDNEDEVNKVEFISLNYLSHPNHPTKVRYSQSFVKSQIKPYREILFSANLPNNIQADIKSGVQLVNSTD